MLKGPPATAVPVSHGKTSVPLKASPPGCRYCFCFEFELPDKQHAGSPPPSEQNPCRYTCTLQPSPAEDVIRKGNYLLLENVLVPCSYSAAQICGVLPITHQGKSGKRILQQDNSACRLLFYVFLFPSSFSTPTPSTFSIYI